MEPVDGAILVERRQALSNVGFRRGDPCVTFSRLGMGQGTLSFSKENPDPF